MTTHAMTEAQMCPQVQHTVHASVMQADAIGSLLANHTAMLKNALEATTCAVEHTDAHRGAPY
jgi:hypothetical protein